MYNAGEEPYSLAQPSLISLRSNVVEDFRLTGEFDFGLCSL